MKTNILNYLGILGLNLSMNLNASAQVTRAANTSITPATDFVGWNTTVAGNPLRIKTESTDLSTFTQMPELVHLIISE